MNATEVLPEIAGAKPILDDEVRTSIEDGEDEAYRKLLGRLSHQSVVKHFDAYADIEWDAPEMRIDPADPRWQLAASDSLGASEWYRAQPAHVRSAIGLHLFASFMKIGIQFESVLKRGLLEFAFQLPNGSTEFRYVYHEVIEEAQHSLMFQEFVNRAGLDVAGLAAWQKVASRLVIRTATGFPELFFLFVLGGEDPIDHVQRVMMRDRDAVHPLLRRICQIHVTEEARHLSFARLFLRRHVPRLSPFRKRLLRVRAPLILGQLSRQMLQPSKQVVAQHGIPREVLRAVYRDNPEHRRRVAEAVAKVRALCQELEIVSPATIPLWRRFGLWPEASAAA